MNRKAKARSVESGSDNGGALQVAMLPIRALACSLSPGTW